MSIFKGRLSSNGEFVAQDDVRGLRLISTGAGPSYFGLEADDGADWYMWFDDSDNYRKHTSAPTDSNKNTAGSVMFGATNDQASPALDNLASVAINTDLVSDTDDTDDLGSSSKYWAEGYIKKLYLSSSSTVTGGTNVATFDGGITIGSDGDGHDVIFYGETADQYLQWDMDYNSNAGGLILRDNVMLVFGDGADVTMEWNESSFEIESSTDNYVINFGATKQFDIVFHGDTATSDAGWDASADTFQIADDAVLCIGGTGIGTQDGFEFKFVAADSDLYVDPKTANDNIVWGSTRNLDMEFHGANYDLLWDPANDALVAKDGLELAFGNGLDIYMRYEGTGDTLDIGQTVDGTGSVDFIDTPVLLTGADSAGTLLTIAGIDTTGNSDTVLIDHSGDGYAINIDLNEATSDGIKVEAFTNHTVPLILLDGDTAGFLGAANIGMLTIQNDIALTDVASSALVIDVGTTKPIDAAEGYCFRIVDTSLVATSNNAYAAYIDSTANHGMKIETRAAAATNLTLSGVQAQTAAIQIIDAKTGTGWDGADDVGALHITSDSVLVHNGATLLRVDSSAQQKAGAEGALARFENTGTARADAVMVEIAAKDNTEYGLKVSAGMTDLNGSVKLGGIVLYDQTAQTLTGAGAVNVTSAITWIVTTGANALTLADGSEGQRKFIVMKTDSGAGTLTPTNLGNGSTITFDDVGDCADLIFTNAAWHMIGGTATLA